MDDNEVVVDAKTSVESSPIEDAKGAESSTAEKTEQTLADVVKATAEKSKEEVVVEEEKPEGEAKVEAAAEKPSAEKPADTDETLPFNKHPRFQELIKERNEFKSAVEQEKPFVEYAKAVSKFCQENQVSEDDLKVAFELVALAKKDVGSFKQQLRAILENVEITTGDRLPTDLQKKVDDGVIDVETAKELSQARETAKGAKAGQEKAGQSAQQVLQQAIASSLGVWEANKRQNDTDYEKRLSLIRDRFMFLSSTKPPTTAAEAVALAEKAYSEVVGELKQFAPAKPQRKVLSSIPSRAVNGDGKLKPLDSLDDLGDLVKAVAAGRR